MSDDDAGFMAEIRELRADVERLTRERDAAEANNRVLRKALAGLLREEWMTYEGNLEASGHASVDDLNAARAALAQPADDSALRALVTEVAKTQQSADLRYIRDQARYANDDGAYLDYVRGLERASEYEAPLVTLDDLGKEEDK